MRVAAGLLVIAILDAVLIVAAARMPYFPTDLAIARAVQAMAPLPVSWAQWVTAQRVQSQRGCSLELGSRGWLSSRSNHRRGRN